MKKTAGGDSQKVTIYNQDNLNTYISYNKLAITMGYYGSDESAAQETDEPKAEASTDNERLDGGADIRRVMNNVDVANNIHIPTIPKAAEKHKDIAESWRRKIKAEVFKKTRSSYNDPTFGLKKLARNIGKPKAKPLKYVARDVDTTDGEKKARSQLIPR